MLLPQHILCSFFVNGITNGEYLAAVVLPDGIRAYTRQREYSHFEENYNHTDISYLKFPNMKFITNDYMKQYLPNNSHLADIKSYAIGETTKINEFISHNKELPIDTYNGIYDHLIQDYCFDEFIRSKIDCSKKYDGIYKLNNKILNETDVRKLIIDIEQFGIYILSYILNKEYSIITNQDWFDKNIKQILYKNYTEELFNNTYKYITIDDQINDWITNKDWTHLNDGFISYQEYVTFYKSVFKEMICKK